MNVVDQTIHAVAQLVTRKFVQRGCPHDPRDMYQDAVVTMRVALRSYDPSRGTALAGYLYHAGWRGVCDKATKALQPASTRSKSEIKHLRNLKTVEVRDEQDPTDYDALVYRTQVRERMIAVAESTPDGKLALKIMFDLTSVVAEANGDQERAAWLYRCVRTLKRAMVKDEKLRAMFVEGSP